jgi:stage III sporulation protein AG
LKSKGAQKMPLQNFDISKIKKSVSKLLSSKNRSQTIIILGLTGLFLISISSFFKNDTKKLTVQSNDKTKSENRQEKLQQNLEDIISTVEGAGKSKVLLTFESAAETVYATEERKNKEASEDKSDGEVTRKKESDDCEKKYITIKDSEGTEHALAVTEIEPKVKGVIVICPGGDDPIVRRRIVDAVTTSLNIPSKRVCVTKSR